MEPTSDFHCIEGASSVRICQVDECAIFSRRDHKIFFSEGDCFQIQNESPQFFVRGGDGGSGFVDFEEQPAGVFL
jgi:hypothetical protein